MKKPSKEALKIIVEAAFKIGISQNALANSLMRYGYEKCAKLIIYLKNRKIRLDDDEYFRRLKNQQINTTINLFQMMGQAVNSGN